MNKILLHEMILALLIMLFVYTGSSKLLDMDGFRKGMHVQPFPGWMKNTLTIILPWLELIIAAGLVFKKTRTVTLYVYALLMCGFSVYSGLIVFNFFEHRPCGCGGIMNWLNWTGHFIINIIFLALNITCIILNRDIKFFMHKQEVS